MKEENLQRLRKKALRYASETGIGDKAEWGYRNVRSSSGKARYTVLHATPRTMRCSCQGGFYGNYCYHCIAAILEYTAEQHNVGVENVVVATTRKLLGDARFTGLWNQRMWVGIQEAAA